jgi:hypothetical protein
MPSKPELVCQALAQSLIQYVPLVVGRVYRDRTDAFTREESPALLLECLDEDTQTLGGPTGPWSPVGQMDRNELRLALTVVVRDPQWQQVADAVRVQAHAAVMRQAGPLAMSPGIAGIKRTRCEWRAASADLPFGYASQIYVIRYDGAANDIQADLDITT